MSGWGVELRAGADGPVLWEDRGDDYAFETAEDAVSYGHEHIARLVPKPYLIERAGVFVPMVLLDTMPEPEDCRQVFEQFMFDTAWEAHQQACRMVAEAVPVPVQVNGED